METLGDSSSFTKKSILLYKTGTTFSYQSPLRYHSPLIPRSPTPPKSFKRKVSISPGQEFSHQPMFRCRRMSASLPRSPFQPDSSYSSISREIFHPYRQQEIEGIIFLNPELYTQSQRYERGTRLQKKPEPQLKTLPKKKLAHRRVISIDSNPLTRWSGCQNRRV
jgi:hypothetical protein